MTNKSTASDIPFSIQEDEETRALADKFDLSVHLVKLLIHEPFFSSMLRNVSKTRSEALPTAGVTVRNGNFNLLWNPMFFAKMPSQHVRGVLKHECYHLIFKHCTSRKQEPHRLWNWATDLAINSIISVGELPDEGLRPGRALDLKCIGNDPESLAKWQKVSDLIESFPLNESSEWYMNRLMEDKEVADTVENSSSGGEGFSMDDHDGWGDLSDEERQVAEAKIKQALSEAVRRCDRNGQWGSVSSGVREELRKIANNAIDWKKVLYNFCGNSQRSNKSKTHKKVNRKYPYIHPGSRRGHSASVAIYIDQSGSVGNDEIEMLFGALNRLGRITQFTLFPFDYSVDEENAIKWRRGQTVPPKRTRTGGTSFHAVEDHISKNLGEFDGHIILTDGEASDPGPSRSRRCWVILPGCNLYFKPHANDIVVNMDRSA